MFSKELFNWDSSACAPVCNSFNLFATDVFNTSSSFCEAACKLFNLVSNAVFKVASWVAISVADCCWTNPANSFLLFNNLESYSDWVIYLLSKAVFKPASSFCKVS